MLAIYKENCKNNLPQGLEFMNSENFWDTPRVVYKVNDYHAFLRYFVGLFHYQLVTELIKVHQH